MTMDETIIYVNDRLKEGYSIAKAERELNYGKDTLRKKLNRAGYQYDKALKKFIFDANTVITQDITHAEKNILEKNKSNKNEINADIRHTENSVVTNSITHKITQSKVGINTDSETKNSLTQNITHAEKPSITQSNNTNVTHANDRALTDEDFKILFEIIDMYKAKGNITEKNIVIPRDDSELTTRSFRSYKSIFDSFSKYCKENSLNQKDAIADALISYISR
jgi:hypothetical protein